MVQAFVAAFGPQLVNDYTCHQKGQVIDSIRQPANPAKGQPKVGGVGDRFGENPRNDKAAGQKNDIRFFALDGLGFEKDFTESALGESQRKKSIKAMRPIQNSSMLSFLWKCL
ncbi:MAG: hypothetical protein R2788_08515 [Saprospiraceae bacterium]